MTAAQPFAALRDRPVLAAVLGAMSIALSGVLVPLHAIYRASWTTTLRTAAETEAIGPGRR